MNNKDKYETFVKSREKVEFKNKFVVYSLPISLILICICITGILDLDNKINIILSVGMNLCIVIGAMYLHEYLKQKYKIK